MTDTFYDVLGVSPDASTEEVRDAYRRKLKETHPDLSDDEDAGEATKRVIRARDVLTDESERRRYDDLGHEAYVGEGAGSVDDADVSEAARAARRAGWAGGNADGGASRSTGEVGGRRRARDRRRRERAASERVGRTRRTGDSSTADGSATGGATGGVGSTTSTSATNGSGSAHASPDGGAATGGSAGYESVAGSAPSWTGSGGYSVRQGRGNGVRLSRLFPIHQSLPILVVAFALYPVMLFSAVFPPFPLAVNVVVGVCTVLLFAYLQSIPEVGVVVFGLWSLLTPLAFVLLGVSLTSLVGVVALTGTLLPFGLSVLTLWLIRL